MTTITCLITPAQPSDSFHAPIRQEACVTVTLGVECWRQMRSASLHALVGARLAVGFPGTEATEAIIDQLRLLHAQTLVIFSRNFTSPAQFRQLISDLERAVGWRFLVMVDHEGGRVMRFASGVTHFPSAGVIGATSSSQEVERQGEREADELRGLGVHVNLAPCVDVVMPEADPVIGDRSYGADPTRVATLAVARIRGLQSHGVAACAKHFPGLGAVPRDPHSILPTISLDWDTMQRVHLAPFHAAITAGVATVMSSHVCYPMLGDPPGLPATCSPRLIRELLRRQLHFQGPILSDDLEMGALSAVGTIGEAAVQATAAGHDLLLLCSSLTKARHVHAQLTTAYQHGRLDDEELTQSVERIVKIRQTFLSSSP